MMRFRGLGKKVLAIVLVPLFLVHCGGGSIKPLTFNPISQYSKQQEKNGLVLAVDPLDDSEKLKNQFSADILSQDGILPVVVVAENRHSQTRYLVEASQVSLCLEEPGKGKDLAQLAHLKTTEMGAPAPPAKGGGGKGDRLVGVGTTMAILGTLFLPLAVAGLAVGGAGAIVNRIDRPKKPQEDNQVDQKLYQWQLKSKVLEPGESHSGLVYFKIDDKAVLPKVKGIAVQPQDLSTGEPFALIFEYAPKMVQN